MKKIRFLRKFTTLQKLYSGGGKSIAESSSDDDLQLVIVPSSKLTFEVGDEVKVLVTKMDGRMRLTVNSGDDDRNAADLTAAEARVDFEVIE